MDTIMSLSELGLPRETVSRQGLRPASGRTRDGIYEAAGGRLVAVSTALPLAQYVTPATDIYILGEK